MNWENLYKKVKTHFLSKEKQSYILSKNEFDYLIHKIFFMIYEECKFPSTHSSDLSQFIQTNILFYIILKSSYTPKMINYFRENPNIKIVDYIDTYFQLNNINFNFNLVSNTRLFIIF